LDEDTLACHSTDPSGKIGISTTKPTNTQRDLSLAYSPGVAGTGAAATAAARFYVSLGVPQDNITMCDVDGILTAARAEAGELNQYNRKFASDVPDGKLADAMAGSDVSVGLSVDGIVGENESRAQAQVEAVLELPVAAGEGFAESFAEEMADKVRSSDRPPSSVETAVNRLASSDHEFTVHERGSEPAVAILEFAAEHDSDTIILGVSGRSPVGKVLFDSVAQAVILDSDRPVTVVPAHTPEL